MRTPKPTLCGVSLHARGDDDLNSKAAEAVEVIKQARAEAAKARAEKKQLDAVRVRH